MYSCRTQSCYHRAGAISSVSDLGWEEDNRKCGEFKDEPVSRQLLFSNSQLLSGTLLSPVLPNHYYFKICGECKGVWWLGGDWYHGRSRFSRMVARTRAGVKDPKCGLCL